MHIFIRLMLLMGFGQAGRVLLDFNDPSFSKLTPHFAWQWAIGPMMFENNLKHCSNSISNKF